MSDEEYIDYEAAFQAELSDVGAVGFDNVEFKRHPVDEMNDPLVRVIALGIGLLSEQLRETNLRLKRLDHKLLSMRELFKK